MPYWPCLQGFAQLYKDFGQVVNPFSKHTGRPSMIEDENMQHISSLLDATPALYLNEMSQLVDRSAEMRHDR